MNRKTYLVIIAVGAALRMIAMGHAPLWYDENFTLILARLPFDRMISATAGDVHPPLWYMLEWALFHVAPNLPAWAVRIPAVCFSLASLFTFHHLMRVLHVNPHTRVIALGLMAVLPMQLWYAQEGRMYAMLEFFVLFALYAALTRKWQWFTISAIGLVYTQNYGLFYIGVIAAIAAVQDIKRNAAPILGAGIVTMFFYTPWFITITRQMETIEGRYWIMDAGMGAVLGAIYKQFWASAMITEGVIASYFLTFAMLILGVWQMSRTPHISNHIILTMAFAPTALAWIASYLWQPLLLFRPLIGTAPFLYLITAWTVESAIVYWNPWQKSDIAQWVIRINRPLVLGLNMRKLLVTLLFAAPVFMFGVGGYYLNIAAMKGEGAVSPMLDALAYVRANWQEGDVIYYTDDGPMINLMPYASDLPQYKLPACDERIGYAPVLGSLSDTTRDAIGVPSVDLASVPHNRAWVFAPRSPLHPKCYEAQIAFIAPEGGQVFTVDDNEFIESGVWLVDNQQVKR